MNFINYTAADIQSSICNDTIKRGIILDQKLRFLISEAEHVVLPSVATDFELQMTLYNLKKFAQNLKFILYDRLESNCVKTGRTLVIGSIDRAIFEKLFTKWEGERGVKVMKKGRGYIDYSVFVTYRFAAGHKFLEEVPKKIEYKEEFYANQGRVIRQITHSYKCLKFLLNVQTNIVHCEWEQCTEKLKPEDAEGADGSQNSTCAQTSSPSADVCSMPTVVPDEAQRRVSIPSIEANFVGNNGNYSQLNVVPVAPAGNVCQNYGNYSEINVAAVSCDGVQNDAIYPQTNPVSVGFSENFCENYGNYSGVNFASASSAAVDSQCYGCYSNDGYAMGNSQMGFN